MCGKESILHALITIEVGWPSESVGQKKVNCREIVQTVLSCLREIRVGYFLPWSVQSVWIAKKFKEKNAHISRGPFIQLH